MTKAQRHQNAIRFETAPIPQPRQGRYRFPQFIIARLWPRTTVPDPELLSSHLSGRNMHNFCESN
ncbi:hypothetical protein COLO4_23362 [Corchorus olitorius]|uniref:Uncharacterized protein n=1 Tax=Corchorus olitorius TaxID=93759 RepID=A0A1R3IH43_9ROSI|nr:hypothetical protein COLO4_23362 [Corchorus olitorius]